MPLIWRYLSLNFIRNFLLCTSSLVSLLLVARFKEIAYFGSQCLSLEKTLLFISYQIPLVLPLTIPVSILISAVLLAQKISQTNELTTMRASGISIKTLFVPILLFCYFLGLINFSISANLTPKCRQLTKQQFTKETSKSPLILLRNQSAFSQKKNFIHFDYDRKNEQAHHFTMIFPNKKQQRLSLFYSEKISMNNHMLNLTNGSLLTQNPSKDPLSSDVLYIEHQSEIVTNADQISSLLKKKTPRDDLSSLNFSSLQQKSKLTSKKSSKTTIEIFSRISIGLACITFCFLGLSFGIYVARNQQQKHLWECISLGIIFLIIFLIAKKIPSSTIAGLLFLLSHGIIIFRSFKRISVIENGVK